jgi:hypothetical protein
LYLAESNNVASRQLAERVGFVNTGSRQVFADAVYGGETTPPPSLPQA